MDNIERLRAEVTAHAMLLLMNELDRTHGENFASVFIEEHEAAIRRALAHLDTAIRLNRTLAPQGGAE